MNRGPSIRRRSGQTHLRRVVAQFSILHSQFFIPQISPKILNDSPVLAPDETKIKGQKGRKGHPGHGGSRFGGRDTETLVHFQATQNGPGFAGGSRIPN